MAYLQDLYPEDYSHCHGCGRLNPHGLHIKSAWDDGETVCRFTPGPHHIALPGFVYGGLIASLVDCHSIAAGAAASMAAAGEVPGRDETPRFVTGSLHVDYLKPTPRGVELVLRSRADEVGARKVLVSTSVYAGEVEVARGKVTAVRMPSVMAKG
ncbi:MAG TPA: PaaI family thioesterase [Gemmatimonadaceae bacterium]|nr:PaaI family thioesterase [Gemmatimonadaceae bacterium]